MTPTRFARDKHFPKGWEASQSQFLELFHRYGYIRKPLDGGTWLSANEKWKLTDTEILKAAACAHTNFFIGCRSGKTTRFAVLDIDAKSKYHSKRQLARLLSVLEKAGLTRSSLYRSSYSGGWHLYIFFDMQVSSSELRRLLVKLLTLNDFEIAKGTLEVFPNRSESTLGMGLRLPLQPGFAWLDKNDLEVQYERAQLSATKALELFLDALDSDAISFYSYRQFKEHVQNLDLRKEKARKHGERSDNVVPLRPNNLPPAEFGDFVAGVFRKLPPGIIADNWYKGRSFHLNGLTAQSQRAEAIICVGHYFFYGDPSRDLPALGYGYEQEREWALQEFLASRHNGQSKDINDGRPDALQQVARAAHWSPPHRKDNPGLKYTPERPVSWIRENQNRKAGARQRIQQALDELRKEQRAFTTVELQQAAQCSRETLYNHQDIWRATYEDRKNYSDLAVGFFANCTDEYNDAVGADSSQIKPPTASLSENMPPGRRAARQIASEIAMRNQRDIQRAQRKTEDKEEQRDKTWREQVAAYTSSRPQSLRVENLKLFIVVLVRLLSLSPTHEDQLVLQGHINEFRLELDRRSRGPTAGADYG